MFEIIYAPAVKGHLKAVDRKYHKLIRQAIETQLRLEPDVETQNRKPLKRPIALDAEWEIRCGPRNRFRVFYQANREEKKVYILAIGEKRKERLFIGGREV